MDVLRIISSISGVVDSAGAAIGNPGTTEDTVLTLSGIGTANSVVFIFDNGALLTPASVTINGTWLFTETVALGRHAFTVRDELAGGDSPPWVVTVQAVAVKPTISSVVDTAGNPVERGGDTEDDHVVVSGTAQAGERVEINDGADSWGTAIATDGVWTKALSGLIVKSYSITATGMYSSFPVSDAWPFNVVLATAPTIASIKDASRVEIPPNDTTFSTEVTLTGTAAADQQVQIIDETTVLGTATAIGGNWSQALASLTFRTYNVKARGLYGSNPESAVRRFTVIEATRPNISSVRDSTGLIENGDTTTDTTVSLTGTAAANQEVQILDNGVNKTIAAVDASGGWSSSLPGLELGGHSVTAKGLYDSEPVSLARTFTVRAPTPALIIDTSPLALSGHIIRVDQVPATPPANTYATRAASGGSPPYSYSVSDPSVLDVEANTGRIVSRHSGSSTVTVRDSVGQTASYSVSVSNVYWMGGAMGFTWWRDANDHAASVGGHVPSLGEWNLLRSAYGNAPPISNDQAWSTDVATALTRWVINPVGGELAQKHTGLTGPNTAAGWAVISN